MEWITFLKPFPQNPLWLNIPPYLNKYLDLIAFKENVGFEKIDRFFYDIGISIWNQKDIDDNRISVLKHTQQTQKSKLLKIIV